MVQRMSVTVTYTVVRSASGRNFKLVSAPSLVPSLGSSRCEAHVKPADIPEIDDLSQEKAKADSFFSFF